ncbi:NAC domain-containing protein 40 [Citrus sinensis]|uniref:NTM1-like n=1 Tax=Citrus limon TaxID=2708 RepID=A0A1S8ACD8_CITLI|nr:NAC domain-containing protein 60-like [Citrus sinensis]XP_024038729.1 NAC domain-containing protein 60-like [Citrus x clementina]KAH9668824.1 NAC domain-containing protein 40 [Citrus sinensis]
MDSLVGFRFKPTNEEIIRLLKKKRLDPDFSVHTIKEIDFYSFDPWDLPRHSEIQCEEKVWYFYCERYYKSAKSKQAHRRTKSGYWKVTGKGSDIKRKNSTEVIGTKKILPFCPRRSTSKKAKTEWVMHEISVEDDPLYKKDFVVCRLERKRDGELSTSTSVEDQSSPDLTSCSTIIHDVGEQIFWESVLPPDQLLVSDRNHVAENTPLVSPASDDSISGIGNRAAEHTSLGSEVLATNHLISHSGNRVAGNTSQGSLLPLNQNLVSNGNHVAENALLVSPVPPSDHLISCSRNHVAENNSPEWQLVWNDILESPILPNQLWGSYSTNNVENSFEAEPRLLAEFNPHGGYNWLNYGSLSPSQSPIFPALEGSSYGCDSLNSQCSMERVDLFA